MRDIGWILALCIVVALFLVALRTVARQQFAAHIIAPIQTPRPLDFPTAKPWPTFAPLPTPSWKFPNSEGTPASN